MTAETIAHLGYILLLLAFAVPVLRSLFTTPRGEGMVRLGRLMAILSVISLAYILLTTFVLALLRQ
jgi:hypothetical protein